MLPEADAVRLPSTRDVMSRSPEELSTEALPISIVALLKLVTTEIPTRLLLPRFFVRKPTAFASRLLKVLLLLVVKNR